jgi:hypothetical protein
MTIGAGGERPYKILQGGGLDKDLWAAYESTIVGQRELAVYKTREEAEDHARASQPDQDEAPAPLHQPHEGMCNLSNPACKAYIDQLAAQYTARRNERKGR